MRNLILMLALAGFFTLLSSCENEKINPASESGVTVLGSWELRREWGGWSGLQTYPAGNGHIYKFTANRYEFFHDEQLIKRGEYEIVQDTVQLFNQVRSIIRFDHQPFDNMFIVEHTGKTLTLAVDANDAPEMVYERIKK